MFVVVYNEGSLYNSDYIIHHLLGRFCYEVSQVPYQYSIFNLFSCGMSGTTGTCQVPYSITSALPLGAFTIRP